MNSLTDQLSHIAGRRHVLTGDAATRRYRQGYRCGDGPVEAVVRPGTLVELWRVLQACVAHDRIVIMQAANTGLTGGSTPDGAYDRPVVIINTLRLDRIDILDGGRQVLCHAGATLYGLERKLAPLNRDPHSVIGSSCIGASVVGGVCNNSGGALIQRGPAYTEMALYAQLQSDGTLALVNHLDIDFGENAEEILSRLDRGDIAAAGPGAGRASDPDYGRHVRDVDAETPARFNADPRRLYEAAGSAGRLAVFAVRLDTFAKPAARTAFYIGTNDPAALAALRRGMLKDLPGLPISAEYMHRDAYDVARDYGRDVFLAVYHLGTRFLPYLFAAKARVDAMAEKIGLRHCSDRLLQFLAGLFPHHLPPRLDDFRARYSHYLLLETAGPVTDAAHRWLADNFSDGWFECTPDEAKRAQLNRFAAAGAAIRYGMIHRKETAGVIALDIALRRNDPAWLETLPPELVRAIALKLYYGHFFCHVLHQDYVVRQGHDAAHIKAQLLALTGARGAAYPAEHNVGHLYAAAPALRDFYKNLDPCNSFNPGIGKTSRRKHWK
jgi:D-lactate dehydrogenase